MMYTITLDEISMKLQRDFYNLKMKTVVQKLSALASQLSLYLKEIVRLHDVLVSIRSDQDGWFIFTFWREVHEGLGT